MINGAYSALAQVLSFFLSILLSMASSFNTYSENQISYLIYKILHIIYKISYILY